MYSFAVHRRKNNVKKTDQNLVIGKQYSLAFALYWKKLQLFTFFLGVVLEAGVKTGVKNDRGPDQEIESMEAVAAGTKTVKDPGAKTNDEVGAATAIDEAEVAISIVEVEVAIVVDAAIVALVPDHVIEGVDDLLPGSGPERLDDLDELEEEATIRHPANYVNHHLMSN